MLKNIKLVFKKDKQLENQIFLIYYIYRAQFRYFVFFYLQLNR